MLTYCIIVHFSVGLQSDIKREIVFLVDGSEDVRSKFGAIREFMAKMVQSFDLEEGKDKVAVVQFSNNPELSFGPADYKSKEDAIQHIARLKPKGGGPQYIGSALQFVKNNIFISKPDKSVKQILVLLAGGRSRDSPRGPTSAMKTAGIKIFAVGSRLSNAAELQAISSNVNFAYSIPDFINLPRIQQSLMRHLEEIRNQKRESKRVYIFKVRFHI